MADDRGPQGSSSPAEFWGSPAPAGPPPGWYPDPGQVNTQRYWDGRAWTGHHAPLAPAAPAVGNAAATASLVLGILGLLLTPIPLFIGLLLGGPLDVLAVVFGVVGLVKGGARRGAGVTRAVVGLVLGALMLAAITVGAGTIW